MTSLQQLFPEGPRQAVETDGGGAPSTDRLREVIGAPRRVESPSDHVESTERLVALVADAARTARPTASTASDLHKQRRARRKPSKLNIAAGTVAVVALATTGTIAGVQIANASPAAEVLAVLKSDEATILNAEQTFSSTRARLEKTIDDEAAHAAAVAQAVAAVRSAPDPVFVPQVEGEVAPLIPIADGAQLDAFLAQSAAYQQALAEIEVPVMGPAYASPEFDRDSLVEAGDAVDAAQAHLDELDARTSDLRSTRDEVAALTDAYVAARSTFAASFAARAEQVLAENPDAAPAVRDAVTAAAATVVASGLEGDAVTPLTAFRNALLALLVDQQRAINEVPEEGGLTPPPWFGGGGNGGGNDGDGDGGYTPPPVIDPPVVDPPVIIDPDPQPEPDPGEGDDGGDGGFFG